MHTYRRTRRIIPNCRIKGIILAPLTTPTQKRKPAMFTVVKINPKKDEYSETLLFHGTKEQCIEKYPKLKERDFFIEDRNFIELHRSIKVKKRLVILQASGFQFSDPNIVDFIPCDDLEYGKQVVEERNKNTDLPYYLAWLNVGSPEIIRD